MRFFIIGVAIALLFFGCIEQLPGPPVTLGDGEAPLKEVKRLGSYEELLSALNEARTQGRSYGIEDMMNGVPAVAEQSLGQGAGGAKSSDYSRTNIQVEGVDEADIVKTDGKYVYNFSGDNLVITDAFPIETSAILSQTTLDGIRPLEMFVLGDKLLLFGSQSFYREIPPLPEMPQAMPYYYPYRSGSVVQLYDVSDRENPVLEKELSFEGSYLASRLIGSNAYFVIRSYPDYRILEDDKANQGGKIIPMMAEDDGAPRLVAEPAEIGILPPMPAEEFVTIVSFNLDSKEMQKETVLGSAENIYASLDNIYLASTAYLAPKDFLVVDDIQRAIVGDREKTVINKFRLENGKIGFAGQGSVPGHVLNQFSMDEFEQNFRIATTTGSLWGGGASQSKNNLYVLDREMNLVGSLEDLAPGEKIYSARFMGARSYMVTFKKVDPLFVIDVSEPTNPRVLGKLKIPGYSDYLHPFDETHLIGVGKETIEASSELVEGRGLDFAWYQGLKMAIFDVSDVENPKELHKIVIGDRGTDSYALDDHKAFLFDREKELLVLPIELAEIPEEDKKPLEENQRSPAYGVPVFQGAFVFRVNLAEGFVERGRITHISGEEELKSGYYYPSESNVKRALFIENVLYTLSGKMLKANDLDTLAGLKEFVFSEKSEEEQQYPE
ncbi:MAG: beta-propeller domain-containing protein [Candidatus Diapherotrites archaeon]|nr:beta-propeller domain-containing protein [Candidatus Diapherotrites archaeon]